MREFVAFVAFFLVIVWASMSKAEYDLDTCLNTERGRGGIIGFVDFVGEPWDGATYGVGLVPGTGLEVTFEDGTSYAYGGQQSGLMADNLSSLKNIWAKGLSVPYSSVRRNDGSVVLITDPARCASWMMVPPTILPTGWEDHSLARCLTGAYRVTDQVTFESSQTIVANFDGQLVELHSNFGIKPDVVIAEKFDGYVAIAGKDSYCSFRDLSVAP